MPLLQRSPIAAAAVASTASVATLLTSCRTLQALEQVHARMVRKGLDHHPVLATRFLSLCSSLSSPSYAFSFFSFLPSPNLLHWNALLAARRPVSDAVALFNLMRRRYPIAPDAFSFPPLIKSCSQDTNLFVGASLHAVCLCFGLDADPFVRTALIDMYGKCHRVPDARKLLDTMNHANEVSWTAMLVGYLSIGDLGSARELFDGMPEKNVVTWNAMVDGYVKAGDLVGARKLFDEMPQRNAVSFTSLIDGYAKAGDMASAKDLFDGFGQKDLFLWSAMISGFVQNGLPSEALKIFFEFYDQNIKPDEFIAVGLMSACAQVGSLELATWVDAYVASGLIDSKRAHVVASLIDMNAKCGNMERASLLFESMSSRDLVSYCSMMQGYSVHGYGAKAVELFGRMLKERVTPDDVTFTVVLTACSHAGLVEEGMRYFHLMKDDFMIVPSPDHYACIVDLLGRAGRLKEAHELIKQMPVKPHAGAWGALLGACRLHFDIELGEMVGRRLFEIEPQSGGNYVLLSNIYAAADRWADVSEVRTIMRERGVRKIPGRTWI